MKIIQKYGLLLGFNGGVLALLMLILQTSFISAQNVSKDEAIGRAREILSKAREKVYQATEAEKIESLMLNLSGDSYTNTKTSIEGMPEQTLENRELVTYKYLFGLPSRLKFLSRSRTAPGEKTETKVNSFVTINNDQIDADLETFVDGRKISLSEIGEGIAFAAKSLKTDTPAVDSNRQKSEDRIREGFFNQSAFELFPFVLRELGSRKLEFEFIGKAEAENKRALVLQLIEEPNKDQRIEHQTVTRFFFDARSHLLLLVTKETKLKDIDQVEKTFFSDHRVVNGLLVPTKIVKESQTISRLQFELLGVKSSGSKTRTIVELTLDNIELNPKFPEGIFIVKGKKKRKKLKN